MKLYFFSTSFYIINSLILIITVISILIYKTYSKKDYLIIILNIVLELLFNYFLLKSNYFYMFITKLLQFIFSINLNEIIYTNKKSANLFMFYIIWNYILTLFTILLLFLKFTI